MEHAEIGAIEGNKDTIVKWSLEDLESPSKNIPKNKCRRLVEMIVNDYPRLILNLIWMLA